MMELTDNFRAQMSAGDVQGAVASTQNRELSGGGYHAGLGNKIAADRSKLQPDPSNTIANYHEREKELQARHVAQQDQELRLRCIQTCLQFSGANTEQAITAAQKVYDFITGKRSLNEVPSGQ